MALGSTGAMRMGADVNVELGSSSTTQISLGQASVRTLIGVASGAVMFPTNFYGKSNTPPPLGLFYGGDWVCNTVTRINSCGALVGSETNVGTARYGLAGAKVGSNGLFYAGYAGSSNNTVTRINSSGALVGSETTAGTARRFLAGALVGSNGLFYGGYSNTNTVTRINSCGALVGSQTNVGTARQSLAGALVGSNGLFYGGFSACQTNIVTRINSCGALVGSQTNVGTARYGLAGAKVGCNGLFYAGDNGAPPPMGYTNTVTRINSCGALVGSQTTAGTVRRSLAGALVESNGLFYGGVQKCSSDPFNMIMSNTVTRINSCGALVGSQTNVGTARASLAGAGL